MGKVGFVKSSYFCMPSAFALPQWQVRRASRLDFITTLFHRTLCFLLHICSLRFQEVCDAQRQDLLPSTMAWLTRVRKEGAEAASTSAVDIATEESEGRAG